MYNFMTCCERMSNNLARARSRDLAGSKSTAGDRGGSRGFAGEFMPRPHRAEVPPRRRRGTTQREDRPVVRAASREREKRKKRGEKGSARVCEVARDARVQLRRATVSYSSRFCERLLEPEPSAPSKRFPRRGGCVRAGARACVCACVSACQCVYVCTRRSRLARSLSRCAIIYVYIYI